MKSDDRLFKQAKIACLCIMGASALGMLLLRASKTDTSCPCFEATIDPPRSSSALAEPQQVPASPKPETMLPAPTISLVAPPSVISSVPDPTPSPQTVRHEPQQNATATLWLGQMYLNNTNLPNYTYYTSGPRYAILYTPLPHQSYATDYKTNSAFRDAIESKIGDGYYSRTDLETQFRTLYHADAVALASEINTVLSNMYHATSSTSSSSDPVISSTDPDAKLSINSLANSVIITATPEKMAKINNWIDQLDRDVKFDKDVKSPPMTDVSVDVTSQSAQSSNVTPPSPPLPDVVP